MTNSTETEKQAPSFTDEELAGFAEYREALKAYRTAEAEAEKADRTAKQIRDDAQERLLRADRRITNAKSWLRILMGRA